MASKGRVHADKDHLWHMETLGALCAHDQGLLLGTGHRRVDLTDTPSIDGAVRWWEELSHSRSWRGGRAASAAGNQVPRAGLPPDHLRPGVHGARKPRASSFEGALGEALAGAPGIRTRHRGARALRAQGASAPGARVCVRSARAGE
jgi:PNKP adenylyltransferase domain, ligase domain